MGVVTFVNLALPLTKELDDRFRFNCPPALLLPITLCADGLYI